ncbi:hypothetical protein LZC95_51170 [Pendulispora brunnea]|uniref:Uncharacterized protein n=1 Tax=Pendulispora brunnea TaxID=2905690 RepID=A0ABZ2K7W3_9BACT
MASPFREPSPPNSEPARFTYPVNEFNRKIPRGVGISMAVLFAGFVLNFCEHAVVVNINRYFLAFFCLNLAIQAWFWRKDYMEKRIHFEVQQGRLTVTRGQMVLFQGGLRTLRSIGAEEGTERQQLEDGEGPP